MSRKKLIAIGCSYTRDNNKFPVWPTYLAEKLDMECINLGLPRVGNEYISAKLIDSIFLNRKEDIGLVVLMWSGWPRIDFQDIKGEWVGLMLTHNDDKYFDFWGADNNVYHMTMRALRYFLIAQRLLEDIPYLMIQGVHNGFHGYTNAAKNRQLAVQTFINSKIFYEIDEDKFIGWPIMQEIGGRNVDDILNKIDPERKHLRISEEDQHPNAEGHKIIAQELYNAYEKVYM